MRNQKELVRGIIYSKFDDVYGPYAYLWTPEGISEDIRNVISEESMNLFFRVTKKTTVPEGLFLIPLPPFQEKGLVKMVRYDNSKVRGGVSDATITMFFHPFSDPVFYKYYPDFENVIGEYARKIVVEEEKGGSKETILKYMASLFERLKSLLEELKEIELQTTPREEFPVEELLNVNEPEQRPFKVKAIVCGDPSVGKTSLVLRFTDQAFRITYIPTIGVNFSKNSINVDGERIDFVLWDIAGQSKFETNSDEFYQGASVQVLVLDLTRIETFRSVYKWQDDIKRMLNERLPGIILANKNDLVNDRAVSKEELEKVAADLNLSFIETSALTGENVDEAFHELGKVVLEKIR